MKDYLEKKFNLINMGRYYTGDIEGKFAFAVQSSDAADRFGSCGSYTRILRVLL
jgi:hypothetical protein